MMNGARGGRTLTVSLPTDFKSVASADSAIAPAGFALILPYFEMLSILTKRETTRKSLFLYLIQVKSRELGIFAERINL